MTSDIVVRPAHPGELDAVGALTVAGYDAEGYLVRPDGTYDHDYATWLGDATSRGRDGGLLVAVEGDELLGTTTWCPPGSPHRDLATRSDQGEFRTLSVSPTARRRGIGRILVEECLRLARHDGLTEVLLCSLPEMAPAHRLYASSGFTRRPDLDWSPAPGVTLWGFSIDLDPARPVATQ
ncbi:GNAT family N-acetyltransferase [Aeromicrobium sp. CF3.5]|uniref:GNAT family N-acetyltransferase n=1 Tax=Aeromicrobium sp. CF3.5 TaxID=3373078 RepID=UPI003EE549D3